MTEYAQKSFQEVALARIPKAIGVGCVVAFGSTLFFDPTNAFLFTALCLGAVVGGAIGFTWSAMVADDPDVA